MNINRLIKSIIRPNDKEVSIEGDLSNEAPISIFLGDKLFKQIASGAFATVIMLSGSMNASADINPLDIIKPPINVEVSYDTNRGSQYNSNKSYEVENNLMSFSDRKEKDYGSSSLNFNIEKDIGGLAFISAGLIPATMDGLDTTDFQGIDEQSSELEYYAEVVSSPLHLDQILIYDGKEYIKDLFNVEIPYGGVNVADFMNDEGLPDMGHERMSEEEILIHTKNIMSGIKKDPDAYLFLNRVTDALNKNYGSSYSSEDIISKLVRSNTHGEKIFDIYSSVDNEAVTKKGQDVIFSNISSQYNMNKEDLMDLFKLTIVSHEYSHMVDAVYELTTSSEYIIEFQESHKNKSKIEREDQTSSAIFKVKVKKEAFGDLSGMPIALAVYSKKTGIPIDEMAKALTDTMLLFRASTFKIDYNNEDKLIDQDTHIGSVNSVLFWNNHENELIDASEHIFDNLPKDVNNIDFDRDIAPSMEYVYQDYFLSDEFKDELFSPEGTTSEDLNSEINIAKMNAKVQILDAVSNMEYKPIFNDRNLEDGIALSR